MAKRKDTSRQTRMNSSTLLCPLCGTQVSCKQSFHFAHTTVFTCAHCKVRFCQPFIDNKQVYTTQLVKKKAKYLGTAKNQLLPPSLGSYVDVQRKRILDIGCGTGSFLAALQENNEVFGLEISEAYRPFLLEQKIPHAIGILEQELANLPSDYYDMITFWDVFEHLQHPKQILQLALEKLVPTGIIINWTNNYDDNISRIAELTYRLSFGRFSTLLNMSFFSFPCAHNYNFTPLSLERLYREFKLEILETIITDTPSVTLSNNLLFRGILELFYMMNRLSGKGKIICHVVRKGQEYEE